MTRKIVLSKKYLNSTRGKSSARLNSPEHREKLRVNWGSSPERHAKAREIAIATIKRLKTERDAKRAIATEKQCGTCKVLKTFDKFHKNKCAADGVSSVCKLCAIEKSAKWAAANPDKAASHRTGPRKSEYNKKRYVRDRELILANRKVLREQNPGLFKQRERVYAENNPGKLRAKHGRRRASLLNATPSWLSFIQQAQIGEFYELAQARQMQTGVSIHVDHIVPLQGKGVRGLHVPWNLQLLTEKENCSKHNKMVGV